MGLKEAWKALFNETKQSPMKPQSSGKNNDSEFEQPFSSTTTSKTPPFITSHSTLTFGLFFNDFGDS